MLLGRCQKGETLSITLSRTPFVSILGVVIKQKQAEFPKVK